MVTDAVAGHMATSIHSTASSTDTEERQRVGWEQPLKLPLQGKLPLQEATPDTASCKERGVYYTDAAVARFLLRWAITTGQETVLDPSFGGGVFLTLAAERIRELGGDPSRQVYGIEIDAGACQVLAVKASTEHAIARLLNADFFRVAVDELPSVDAVVGNPPFIRYQRFNGAARQAALRRAREAGVSISRLTSSWAPFLVHAIQFVRPGGRLAMVAPAELAHAAYARPVLDYLRRAFSTTRILSFAHKLFPRLSENTVLILAAGRGEPFESFQLVDLPGLWALEECPDPAALPQGISIDANAVGQGRERLLHYLLPQNTRELYCELQASTHVVTLGNLADVGIGYVTGDNDFFHVGRAIIATYDLPASVLRRAVRSGSDLAGLCFRHEDWERLHSAGHANVLLDLSEAQQLPDSIQAYLREGIRRGAPDRYKCRVRDPWYRVPHIYAADAFLTYMSSAAPKLVANEAAAVAPNTLHIVRLHLTCPLDAMGLAVTWQTSLSALSCELEGHSLGGGMLKLEPGEARRVMIALPSLKPEVLGQLASELDGLLRAGKPETACELADRALLTSGLGLSQSDIGALREGWRALQARRLNR